MATSSGSGPEKDTLDASLSLESGELNESANSSSSSIAKSTDTPCNDEDIKKKSSNGDGEEASTNGGTVTNSITENTVDAKATSTGASGVTLRKSVKQEEQTTSADNVNNFFGDEDQNDQRSGNGIKIENDESNEQMTFITDNSNSDNDNDDLDQLYSIQDPNDDSWIKLREVCTGMGLRWKGGYDERFLLRQHMESKSFTSGSRRAEWKWQKNDAQLVEVKKLLHVNFISGTGVRVGKTKKTINNNNSSDGKIDNKPKQEENNNAKNRSTAAVVPTAASERPRRSISKKKDDDDESRTSSTNEVKKEGRKKKNDSSLTVAPSPYPLVSSNHITLRDICMGIGLSWEGGNPGMDYRTALRNENFEAKVHRGKKSYWEWDKNDPDVEKVREILIDKFGKGISKGGAFAPVSQKKHYKTRHRDDKIRIVDKGISEDEEEGETEEFTTLKDICVEMNLSWGGNNPGSTVRSYLRTKNIKRDSSGKYSWKKTDPALKKVRKLIMSKFVESRKSSIKDYGNNYDDEVASGESEGEEEEEEGSSDDVQEEDEASSEDDEESTIGTHPSISKKRKRHHNRSHGSKRGKRKNENDLVVVHPDTMSKNDTDWNNGEYFPQKLFEMLSDIDKNVGDIHNSQIVSWVSNGKCFRIDDISGFISIMIPQYFADHFTACRRPSDKYDAFQRQLKLFGWTRVEKGSDKNAYYHCHFQRNKPRLLYNFKPICMKLKGKGMLQAYMAKDKQGRKNKTSKRKLKDAGIENNNKSGKGSRAKKIKPQVLMMPPPALYLVTIDIITPVLGFGSNFSTETKTVGIYTSTQLAIHNTNVAFEKESDGYFVNNSYTEEALYEFERAENHVESFLKANIDENANIATNTNLQMNTGNKKYKIYHMQDYNETEVIAYITRLAVDKSYLNHYDDVHCHPSYYNNQTNAYGAPKTHPPLPPIVPPPRPVYKEYSPLQDYRTGKRTKDREALIREQQQLQKQKQINTMKTPKPNQNNPKLNLSKYAQPNQYTSKKGKSDKVNPPDNLRGITMRPSGKWQAQLFFAGKSRYLGVFESRDAAATAYEIARKKLTLEKAQLEQSEKGKEKAANKRPLIDHDEARDMVDNVRESLVPFGATFPSRGTRVPSPSKSAKQPTPAGPNPPVKPTTLFSNPPGSVSTTQEEIPTTTTTTTPTNTNTLAKTSTSYGVTTISVTRGEGSINTSKEASPPLPATTCSSDAVASTNTNKAAPLTEVASKIIPTTETKTNPAAAAESSSSPITTAIAPVPSSVKALNT